MLRKENIIKWTTEDRQEFSDIKKALTQAPVCISSDFSKYFQLFSFSSEHTIAGVLLPKNQQYVE